MLEYLGLCNFYALCHWVYCPTVLGFGLFIYCGRLESISESTVTFFYKGTIVANLFSVAVVSELPMYIILYGTVPPLEVRRVSVGE